QIILYDTTRAASDGNCEFVFQYLTANQTSSATVGEQDPTTQIAIQALYNTAYHRAAMPIVPGRAIKFTTDTIVTGLAEGANVLSSRRLGLAPSRNPFSRSVVLNYALPSAAQVRVSVCDASGRVVRDLVNSGGELVAPGVYSVAWNCRDDSGRELPAGIYFYRLTSSVGNLSRKAVLTR
ncbi:MAG: FlgD immunoglobulin-like domain containing protein, partial [candidate division WOR-3 bacterium]